ncbi:hypothetical protein KA005_71675 [bacterium]|nr:hypothetical protein [bacterium]
MLKKRSVWVDRIVCFFAGFLFAWFTIWATYTALERQSRDREIRLQKIERIILAVDTIEQERVDINEWNQQAIKPSPTVVVVGEEQ